MIFWPNTLRTTVVSCHFSSICARYSLCKPLFCVYPSSHIMIYDSWKSSFMHISQLHKRAFKASLWRSTLRLCRIRCEKSLPSCIVWIKKLIVTFFEHLKSRKIMLRTIFFFGSDSKMRLGRPFCVGTACYCREFSLL